MRDRDIVSSHYPEAEVVEEVLPSFKAASARRCCWFVYDGPELDARVLGRGATECEAWGDAARKLKHSRPRVRVFLAD